MQEVRQKSINRKKVVKFLGFSIIGLAIIQSNDALAVKGWKYFGNIPSILFQLLLIFVIYLNRKYLCPIIRNPDYKYIRNYLKWTFFLIGIGLFLSENYIEYRQLLVGGISLQVPIFAWLFCRPDVSKEVLSIYYRYAWLPFLFLFFPFLGFPQMYLQPILLLVCFASLFKKRIAFCIIVVGLLYATDNVVENRGPFIKGLVAFAVCILIYYRNRLSLRIIKIGHIVGYLCSIFLFVFIFADLFGVLVGSENASDPISRNRYRDTQHQDTRSLLYIDAINSSIEHKYYIFGHTPARGFEVRYSTELFFTENTQLNKGERHKNEMVLANIFTWEGVVGLVLYSLIYMRASYLAVYRSKNKIIPILGCFVAWRWSWGWVEDVNNFMLTDIDLWALIGICISVYFRKMTDDEFSLWARSLLSFKKHL